MAGDWIKMRGNLWDDPRVSKLCDLCDCGEAQVVGGLYWLWAAADQHTENGVMPGLTLRQIDRKTGIPSFGDALCAIGWLADCPEGVRIVNFEEHNGTSAKRRCTDAQRKANVRSVSASDADKTQTEGGQKTPNLGAREREEKRDIGSAGAELPTKTVTARMLVDEGVDKQTADDWLTLRKAKRLPLTPTAWSDTKAEGAKVGLTPPLTVAHAVRSNWAGFKASWYTRDAGEPVAQVGSFV